MTYDDGRMPHEQLAALAAEAGALLGMSLDTEWEGPGVRLGIAGDGVTLTEPYSKRGYVEVRGRFPLRTSWHAECKPITVRADRGGRVLAAEIERRLLPRYREAVEKALARSAEDTTEEWDRGRLAAAITGLFPGNATRMPGHMQGNRSAEVIIYLPGNGGGCVKFNSDAAEVEFKRFRVPAAVALRMLETVSFMTRFDADEER